MLALIVAAACLWRGLTAVEANDVEAHVQAVIDDVDLETLDAAQAREILVDAIDTVLRASRP